MCDDGFTFDPNDIAAGCIDIDECDAAIGWAGRCGQNARCSNTLGGFNCNCPEGFSGDAFKECFDINECLIDTSCGIGASCVNNQGSFTCECPEGTVADPEPNIRCSEILTCSSDKDCPGNAICDPVGKCLCPEPNIGNDCRRKYQRYCFLCNFLFW